PTRSHAAGRGELQGRAEGNPWPAQDLRQAVGDRPPFDEGARAGRPQGAAGPVAGRVRRGPGGVRHRLAQQLGHRDAGADRLHCPGLFRHPLARRRREIFLEELDQLLQVEEAGEEPAVAVNAQSRRDLEMLQGRWEQVALEIDGVVQPADDLSPPGAITSFTGDRFAVHAVDGALLLEGRLVLEASTDPKHVDWIDAIGADAGRRLPAIYRLDGNHFVFVAADTGAPRPAAFNTGSGQVMRTF